MKQQQKIIVILLAALALLVLPLVLQGFGNAWVRIADMALLYVLLSLGLNIVVGYAGLLDLGYVAFFAIGAYMYGLLASPQLTEAFEFFAAMFPQGMHTPLWIVVPAAAGLAGLFGVLLGDSQWTDVVAFVVLVLVLLVRPSGILGQTLGRSKA